MASSAAALQGEVPAEKDVGELARSIDALQAELGALAPARRPCALCQALGDCVSWMPLEAAAGDARARDLAETGLAMVGYVSFEAELPAALRSRLPPEGGPPLSRLLAASCQACLGASRSTDEQDPAAMLAACQRLRAARKRLIERQQARTGEKRIDPLPESDRDPCDLLEACALDFIRIRWPFGGVPAEPDEVPADSGPADSSLARALDTVCPQAIDRAIALVDEVSALRAEGDGGEMRVPAVIEKHWRVESPCPPGSTGLGAALRQVCRVGASCGD